MIKAIYLWTLVASREVAAAATMASQVVASSANQDDDAHLFPSSHLEDIESVESRFMIHIPHKLFKAEGYKHQESQFGIPHYGGAIVQELVYTDSTLCTSNSNDNSVLQNTFPEEHDVPFILMVDIQGGCSVAHTVRNAQDLGAAAVILAGDKCVCSDEECLAADQGNANNVHCYPKESPMVDEGKGKNMISIPSFVISKRDADHIKEELMYGSQYVKAEMSWSMPHSTRYMVDYELWMNPFSLGTADFFDDFMVLANAMESFTRFRARGFILDGEQGGCRKGGDSDCDVACTNHGRYCASNYLLDDNEYIMISGRDIVRENLRRICIWNLYGHDGYDFAFGWWEYVVHFSQSCVHSSWSTKGESGDHQCIQDAYNSARIIKEDVDTCMENSGGLDDDRINALLELELRAQKDRQIVSMPSVIVNDALVPGSFSAGNVFLAICAGFDDLSKPNVCLECSNCYNPTRCFWRHKSKDTTNWQHAAHPGDTRFQNHHDMVPGGCFEAQLSVSANRGSEQSPSNIISIKFFGFSIFFIGAIAFGLAMLHHRRQRVEMRSQVRSIMGSYMPLHCEEDI